MRPDPRPADERERADLAPCTVHHGAALEHEVALPHVRAGVADVLAAGHLRERLNLVFLDLLTRGGALRAVDAGVFDHDHRVGPCGKGSPSVDAEDRAWRHWRREGMRAGCEDLVYTWRVGC